LGLVGGNEELVPAAPWTNRETNTQAIFGASIVPSPCLYIDPCDPQLASQVAALKPTPGYCIFIDVVGSTEMKRKGIRHWVALIHNCFADVNSALHPFPPLKGIGDELMYYIEEADLQAQRQSALGIYDALFGIAGNKKPDFPETKICAGYAEDVYPLTFLARVRDYYGSDIDRIARLKSASPQPAARSVLIDNHFYDRVREAHRAIGNAQQFDSFQRLKGPERMSGKGVPEQIQYYQASAD
jgi:hypothetical protein